MGRDLRSAMVAAGLATEEQAKKVEETKTKAMEKLKQEAVARQTRQANQMPRLSNHHMRYDKNRLGVTPAFMRWAREGKIPDDYHKLCFYCGMEGVTMFDAIDKIQSVQWEEGEGFLDFYDKQLKEAQKIGKTGMYLRPINAMLVVMFGVPEAKVPLFKDKTFCSCVNCIEFILSPFIKDFKMGDLKK